MALDPGLVEAVNYIQSHAHQMRAVLTVADAVKSIGDLERLAGEVDSAVAANRATLEDVKAELAVALDQVEDAKDEAKKHRAAGKKTVDDANDKAKGIVADALDEAKAITKEAEREAMAGVAAVKADLDTVKSALSVSRAELGALNEEIDAKAAEVRDLEERAQKARDYLKGLASA